MKKSVPEIVMCWNDVVKILKESDFRDTQIRTIQYAIEKSLMRKITKEENSPEEKYNPVKKIRNPYNPENSPKVGTKILREGLSNILKSYDSLSNSYAFKEEIIEHIIQYCREDFETEADIKSFPAMLKDFLERHRGATQYDTTSVSGSIGLVNRIFEFLFEKAEEESNNG